jgi:uncharacterized protein YdeI (YjbR/CyaY-like superfamily)
MANKHDERVDAYIERQADFARPILQHLRSAVHSACPEAEETLKWSAPAFMYKGEILAMMAGFKQHTAFNFSRGTQVTGDTGAQEKAMGQFGRMASLDDVPDPETFAALVRKAMALTDAGVKPPQKKKAEPTAPAETPVDLRSALDANPEAAATFDGFSPSCRREYVQWVTEAKQAATREKRIAQAVEWMAEGKKRNWKYEKC